jgi:hypothetical protein
MWRLFHGISSCGFCMVFFLSILIYGAKCKVLKKEKIRSIEIRKKKFG